MPQSVMTSPLHLSNSQAEPTNASVENERQIKEKLWAIGNIKSVSREFKNFRPQSAMTLPIQLSNRQADPTNASVENERQIKEKLRAKGNFKSV